MSYLRDMSPISLAVREARFVSDFVSVRVLVSCVL
jgi:hypothetical protein